MLIKNSDRKHGAYVSSCMYMDGGLAAILRPEYRGILSIGTATITIKPNILLREPVFEQVTRPTWAINERLKLCL